MTKKIVLTLIAISAIMILSGFTPRYNAPSQDEYYYSAEGNLYAEYGWPMPNCAAYAWGRVYEITGVKPTVNPGHAKTWFGTGGYETGWEPALGAVMCWNGGSMGHVAVVEAINDDGTVVISESHSSGGYFNTAIVRADGSDYVGFQGYIYTNGMPVPRPEPQPQPQPEPQPAPEPAPQPVEEWEPEPVFWEESDVEEDYYFWEEGEYEEAPEEVADATETNIKPVLNEQGMEALMGGVRKANAEEVSKVVITDPKNTNLPLLKENPNPSQERLETANTDMNLHNEVTIQKAGFGTSMMGMVFGLLIIAVIVIVVKVIRTIHTTTKIKRIKGSF